jgi:hypothetical protein
MSEPSQLARQPLRPLDNGQPSSTRFPQVGELVLANYYTAGATCPPTSGVSFTEDISTGPKAEGEMTNSPHICIVASVTPQRGKWALMVMATRTYSKESDPVKYVANMSDSEKDKHVPLPPPPSSPPLATPAKFGSPVTIGLVSRQFSWIVAEMHEIPMGPNGWVRSVPTSNFVKRRFI